MVSLLRAIVLIDRVINNEKQGMPMKQALIEAGGTRIRPILMTAIATIGALVPLLFGHDSSILISKGMAATVIGGLISSTLLTLFIIIVYLILVITFRGGLAPFTILFSLPFTVIGVVLHHYRRNYFSSSLIGMLMLVSLLRAIVLIDRVINNENKVCR